MTDTLKIQIDLIGGDNGANSLAGISGQTANSNAQAVYSLNRAIAAAKQLSTQIENSRVSTINSSTGNNALQEGILTALNVAVNVADIAACFPENPALGILKIVNAGANFAVNIANLANRNNEITWQNRAANELARRAGYLSDQNR